MNCELFASIISFYVLTNMQLISDRQIIIDLLKIGIYPNGLCHGLRLNHLLERLVGIRHIPVDIVDANFLPNFLPEVSCLVCCEQKKEHLKCDL